jgi:hypothetical protein
VGNKEIGKRMNDRNDRERESELRRGNGGREIKELNAKTSPKQNTQRIMRSDN